MISAAIQYNGTIAQFQNAVLNTPPLSTDSMPLSINFTYDMTNGQQANFCIDAVTGIVYPIVTGACSATYYPNGSETDAPTPMGASIISATDATVMQYTTQDIGTQLLSWLAYSNIGLNVPAVSTAEFNTLAQSVGASVLSVVSGIDTATINNWTVANLADFFQNLTVTPTKAVPDQDFFNPVSGGGTPGQVTGTVTITGLGTLSWPQISAALFATGGPLASNEFISEPIVNQRNVSSNLSPELMLMGGYLTNRGKLFYGAEASIDLGNTRIGDNNKDELEVKYNFTLSLVGRVGYSFVKKSFTYINAGLAFRQYKTSYIVPTNSFIDYDKNSTVAHFLLGVGMEYALTPKWNIFTEFNHIASLQRINPNFGGVSNLNFRTEKLNIGVKYYFGKNPVYATGQTFASDGVRSNQNVSKALESYNDKSKKNFVSGEDTKAYKSNERMKAVNAR
jgi:hypothetical protein